MRNNISSKYARIVPAALATLCLAAPAEATDFSAKAVMEKMQANERFPYIAGVIEGLAYSRFVRDGKKTEGMGCIYDWFYEKHETINLIYAAFGQYPDYTPAAVINALAKKACGD